ncbi:hypothetical protein DCC62_03130 [candidate division KSB1 bacterium]|nr:MAG: hypothetical protein DCC62_03130 [candidate division KSB1 bacterium]
MDRLQMNRTNGLRQILIIVLLFGATSSLAQLDTAPRYYWRHFIVDRESPVGISTALAYDSKGFPQIAYRKAGEDGTKTVKYARFDGTDWQTEIVDPEGQGRVAMTMDSQDQPHIIYHAVEGNDLMHAMLTETGWTTKRVDTGLRENRYYTIDLKADSNDGLHIVYARHVPVEISYERMIYAIWDNGNITANLIIEDAFTGKWAALALDAQERPHTAYYNFGGDLRFAYLDQGTWKHENVTTDGFSNSEGFYACMQYGRDNNFYISFQNQTTSKLRMARGRPGQWQVEEVTDLTGWEVFATPNPLVLDRDGNPHIAFYDEENADLKLAFKIDGQWWIEPIDTVGDVGKWASMALTPEGLPAISYYDATSGHLRLAVSSVAPPLDSDGDGLPDYIEVEMGANPFDADSDDDGLADGEENLNHNGIVERYETDPRNPDTDNDGIQDGVEFGRTVGVPSSGNIDGTNPNLFHGDSDPITKTNPLIFDTDRDGLGDGSEDKNANGRVDVDESDPNNPDTDADGILDGLEVRLGSSPVDLDSDDDGIADNEEDKNLNGVREETETDPSAADTDGDGVADGIELGVTSGINDPDGGGPLKGTNQNFFRPDDDPSVNSKPLLWDSDGDGLSDGEEDANRNGAVDPGETHFLKNDSDGDGVPDGDEAVFGSDPLQATSRARIDALFTDSFLRTDLAGWEIVDEGTIEAPSDWQTFENALLQTGNIWGGTEFPGAATPNRPGTFIGLKNFSGTDVKISFVLRSNDDDELGVLFRFKDKDNYYSFSLDSQQGYRRLTKIVNGNASVITAQNFSYRTSHDYPVVVYAVGSNLRIYFDGRRVFDIQDEALQAGSLAFFTWKNDGALFKNVKIAGRGTIVSIDDGLLSDSGRTPREFSLSEVFPNPSSGEVQMVLHSPTPTLASVRIFDILGRVVNEFESVQYAGGVQELAWNGRDKKRTRLPAGVYFFHIRLMSQTEPGKIMWQQWRKVIRLD